MKKLDEIAGVPGPSFTSGDEKAMNDLMEGTVPGAKKSASIQPDALEALVERAARAIALSQEEGRRADKNLERMAAIISRLEQASDPASLTHR